MILRTTKYLLFVLVICQNLFAQNSLLFVIRVDDIQSRNITTLPRSILDFENAVQQRGGKVTWAVIPHRLIETQNVNGVLQQELRESILRGNEIALHGYNHICPICGSSSHEMFCTAQNFNIPYSQQKDSLIIGLNILHDSLNVFPISFVPPGHAQDTITFQTLLDLGIEFLSSNGETKNFIYKNLFNLKQNNEFTWQLSESQYQQKMQSALSEIRTVGLSNSYYCILLHDPFIRHGYENGIVIRWIGELLDSINIEYGNMVRYKTLSEAAAEFKHQQTTSVANEKNIPVGFELYQNYPNPFNPITKIEFELPVSCNVNLEVYSITGELITKLAEGERASGYYSLELNSLKYNLSSGVYIYRLRAVENTTGKVFTSIKKMVLLK